MWVTRALLRAFALVGCSVIGAHGEDHYAVLVAGSNGYGNYRHQADLCHAYHVLLARGFHPDHIITMMYDDVASSTMNPFPGKLFNFPWKTMEEAVDVYEGCRIDYRKFDVTPAKFLAVLTGDADKAGGRVLQSGPEDHVFVNFVDHGAVGIIGCGFGFVHTKDLINALATMHDKKMYKQLMFYLETCESGSMFQGVLPKHLPVYAVTAANARESSWGTYCGGDAMVGGQNIMSCLGDLFSVNWMMDSDTSINTTESLAAQYNRVKKATDKSHVMKFGQIKHIGHEKINDFEGPGNSSELPHDGAVSTFSRLATSSAIDSRDATLDSLYHVYRHTGTTEAAAALAAEVSERQRAKALGEQLVALAAGWPGIDGTQVVGGDIAWTSELLQCHYEAATAFHASCGWREQTMPLSRTLYDLCVRSASDGRHVQAAIRQACGVPAPDVTTEVVV